MTRILLSVFLAIFINISSYAEVPSGNNKIDEKTDFENLLDKAKAGDPKACFLAGVLASKIPETQSTGKQLLEKGAELGNPDCVAALGQASEQGLFGEIDLAKALKYYKKGAEMNHSISMLKLSNMYREGKGTPQDYKLSGKWAMKAAKCGLRRACINVGLQYMMGWGTPKNMTRAFVFYHIAGVEDEIAKAQAFLIYEKLTTEEKLKAEEIMMKWEKIFPPPTQN
jgi:TPR repeat protein